MRRFTLPLALPAALVAALVLAGCGGDEPKGGAAPAGGAGAAAAARVPTRRRGSALVATWKAAHKAGSRALKLRPTSSRRRPT
jgi:hypothetical protein